MNVKQIVSILLVVGLVTGMFVPMLAVDNVSAQSDTNIQGIDLEVYPDRALDASVDERESDDGLPLYSTRGNTLEVKPVDLSASDVRSYGVEGNVGSLSYDSDIDRYVFDAERTDGTYKLYWTTREQTEVDNSTVTEEVRHEAYVRVSDSDFTVIPSGEYSQTQENAQLWEEWESNLQDLFGEDVDVQQKTDNAFQFLRWQASGLQIITEDVTNIVVIFGLTWGGRLLLITILLVIGIGTYKAGQYFNKREKNDPYERDIVERETNIQKREAQQMLQGVDLEDVFSDTFRADLHRESTNADNLDEWFKQISVSLSPSYLFRFKLHVLDKMGYKAIVSKDEDDVITNVEFTDEDVELDDNETEESLVNTTDEIINFAMKDEFVRDYNLNKSDVNPENIEPVEINGEHVNTLEGLINCIDDDLAEGPIESKKIGEEWIKALDYINQHPATDSRGNVLPMRTILNDIVRIFRVVSDKHEVPIVREQGRAIEYLLQTSDVEKDASNIVNKPTGGDD